MIDGPKMQMSTEELATRLADRILWHLQIVEEYEEELRRPEAQRDDPLMLLNGQKGPRTCRDGDDDGSRSVVGEPVGRRRCIAVPRDRRGPAESHGIRSLSVARPGNRCPSGETTNDWFSAPSAGTNRRSGAESFQVPSLLGEAHDDHRATGAMRHDHFRCAMTTSSERP